MADDGEKAPQLAAGARHVETASADFDQVAVPLTEPIGDAASVSDGGMQASRAGTLADCAELMFLSSAEGVVPSGVPPTHSASANKLMTDVGVEVDLLFDGPRRPKIPRGDGFLDKMEARAYLLADRIGHGLLPPIPPPDPSSANAIGKRAHRQVGAVAAKHGKAKVALAAAIRKERREAGKDPTLADGLEERVAGLERDAAEVASTLDDAMYDLKLPPAIRPSRKRKAPPVPVVPRPPSAFEEATAAYRLQQKAAADAKTAAILASADVQAATRRLDKAQTARDALGEKPDLDYFVLAPALGDCSDRECAKRAREEERFEAAEEALAEAHGAFDQAVEAADLANEMLRKETRRLKFAYDDVIGTAARAQRVANSSAIDRVCSPIDAEWLRGQLLKVLENSRLQAKLREQR